MAAHACRLEDGRRPQRALGRARGLCGRRPVIQAVLTGHAVAIVVVAEAAEATHDAAQAIPLLQLVSLPFQQAQSLLGPVQPRLVALTCCAEIVDVGAFDVVVAGNALFVRRGAQRGGEVEHVVVYGALELAQGRDEGGFRVVLLSGYVSHALRPRLCDNMWTATSERRVLTGELAGGIMTKQAAQRAWRDGAMDELSHAMHDVGCTMSQEQRRVLGESDATCQTLKPEPLPRKTKDSSAWRPSRHLIAHAISPCTSPVVPLLASAPLCQ